jgi:hypothetical protein
MGLTNTHWWKATLAFREADWRERLARRTAESGFFACLARYLADRMAAYFQEHPLLDPWRLRSLKAEADLIDARMACDRLAKMIDNRSTVVAMSEYTRVTDLLRHSTRREQGLRDLTHVAAKTLRRCGEELRDAAKSEEREGEPVLMDRRLTCAGAAFETAAILRDASKAGVAALESS